MAMRSVQSAFSPIALRTKVPEPDMAPRVSRAMSEEQTEQGSVRQGPLNPAADDGVVVVQDPPNDPMHMTPDEADISGIRMMDAADRARNGGDRKAVNDD